MRKVLWALMTFMIVVVLPGVSKAAAPTYSAIYVFGDSYCDVGNIFIATEGSQPAPPYYKGRFSNGPIWVEHVAGALGLPLKASLAGGTDYAVGGAWATAPQTVSGQVIPSVPEQVGLYLKAHDGKADPNALYLLEGGGNDILGTFGGSAEELGFKIATALATSEFLLRQAGAKHFVISDLIDVSQLPAGKANASFDHTASLAANAGLNTLLKLEDLLEDVHILRVDVFSLLNAIETDPAHFGFSNVATPCLATTVCADPDHTLFWDAVHPSEFGHSLLATNLEVILAQQRRQMR